MDAYEKKWIESEARALAAEALFQQCARALKKIDPAFPGNLLPTPDALLDEAAARVLVPNMKPEHSRHYAAIVEAYVNLLRKIETW